MAEPAAPVTAPPTSAPPAPQPKAASPQADQSAGNTAPAGLAESEFVAKLGAGMRLSLDALKSRDGVDLTTMPQPVPGLRLTKAKWAARGRSRVEIDASLTVPHLDTAAFKIQVDDQGKPSVSGSLKRRLPLAALNNPEVALSLSEDGVLGGSVTIAPANLTPPALRKSLTVTGGGTLTIQNGLLTGNVDATLAYARLGDGEVHLAVNNAGDITGSGKLRVTPPFLNSVEADLALAEDGNLTGSLTVAMTEAVSPIPALSLTGGTLTVGYANGTVSGSLSEFRAAYRGLADVTASLSIANGVFSGQGDLVLTVPGLKEAKGTIRVANGAVSGSMTLAANAFPEALPIKSGRINVRVSENGRVAFDGTVGVELGPAGAGQLVASYSETGDLSIAATINLTIPGLQGAQVSVAYVNGDISGEAQVPIDPSLIPGLSGNAVVRYQQGVWSGETEIAYSADNGKLSGRIRVTVAQTEAGALQLGGTGEVEAQIAPRLRGMLTATILPEGGVDVSGRITVTEPLELFPEAKFDKELFKYAQNIPLWAILVAVIRVRAGLRGGVGPGVFRNITVEGSYTIGNDEADPTFSISGEMFIPAFIEAYIAFGAGLGLDVVIGELTGGIEGVATAGIYGAVSVVPELSYQDGDWAIEGDARLAAGARLKIGLNAWAEVEALWVTVWEETWKLGEWVWNVGPDLSLTAHMAYRFGQPGPPELEFNASDIDTESMIQAAMPKDGPAPSGAREALQNKAEWKGKLREQKPAPVPPDLAAQSQAPPPAPPPPAQPKPKPPAPPQAPQAGAPAAPAPAVKPGEMPTSGLPAAVPGPGVKPGEAPAAQSDQPVTVVEQFTMQGVPHTLTTIASASSVSVIMESARGDLAGKIDALIPKIEENQKRLRRWRSIINKLRDIRNRYTDYNKLKDAYARKLGETYTFLSPPPDFVREYTHGLVSEIVSLAENHRFTDLLATVFLPDPLPDKRYIPEPPRSKIRWLLYERGSDWDNVRKTVVDNGITAIDAEIQAKIVAPRIAGNLADATKAMNDMKARGKVLDGATLDDFQPKVSYVSRWLKQYAVDHDPSLAEHWVKQGGNQTSDAERRKIVEGKGTTTLDLVTRSFNSSKSSRDLSGELNKFKEHAWISPPFTSEIAKDVDGNANTVDAVTIDTHSLTDEKGVPFLPI